MKAAACNFVFHKTDRIKIFLPGFDMFWPQPNWFFTGHVRLSLRLLNSLMLMKRHNDKERDREKKTWKTLPTYVVSISLYFSSMFELNWAHWRWHMFRWVLDIFGMFFCALMFIKHPAIWSWEKFISFMASHDRFKAQRGITCLRTLGQADLSNSEGWQFAAVQLGLEPP